LFFPQAKSLHLARRPTMNPPPITIRRATPHDAADFARIMGHPEVQPGLMQQPYASEDRWRAMLTDGLQPGKPDLQLVAVQTTADGVARVVGTAGLHQAGPAVRRRHVMSVGLAVAADAQGQGVGRALMEALCHFADHWGQVLRIELHVYTDNARAIALYRSLGFVQEGVHRGYALRDGQYVDSMSMARLHPSPPRIAAWETA
jgi:putative acetyltransferase